MNPAELLARLAAGSIQMDRVPGGSVPELTQTDIAAALTGVPESAELLVRVKYGGDNDYKTRRKLEIKAWIAATDLAIQQHWKLEPGKNTLEPLAKLALDLVIDPPRCGRCLGRGHVQNQRGVVRMCSTCSGSGKRKMTNSEKAKRIGVHRNKWPRTWEPRLRDLMHGLGTWEQAAIDMVSKLTRG